jgi:hypothetical protein
MGEKGQALSGGGAAGTPGVTASSLAPGGGLTASDFAPKPSAGISASDLTPGGGNQINASDLTPGGAANQPSQGAPSGEKGQASPNAVALGQQSSATSGAGSGKTLIGGANAAQ